MFWGLIMEPNKRYTQTVERSFHVSMASLDAATADDKIVQVMLCYEDRHYLLCSLKQNTNWQVPLDLNFQEGTQIAFTSNGRGHVHLTGYLIVDEEDDLDLDELEEEEEDDEEEVPQLVGNQPKRKALDSPKDNKKAKRLKAALAKAETLNHDEDDEDNDDDSDDEDKTRQISDTTEDDSDEEEDDDEDDDDDSEEEEEEVEIKPQQKKKKQIEKQQQQASKKEKQKLVNGKDGKQELTKQQQKKLKSEQQQQEQNNSQQAPKKRIVQGGLQIEDLKVGSGTPAKSGKFISVYYVGRLKNGKKFDATLAGEGFKFRLGKGEVIKGWDVGIAGMKCGGKRRITIPPAMAYGAKGSPPTIPANSTLIFEVELKNVH